MPTKLIFPGHAKLAFPVTVTNKYGEKMLVPAQCIRKNDGSFKKGVVPLVQAFLAGSLAAGSGQKMDAAKGCVAC